MSFWPGIISQGITPDAPIFSMSSVTSTSITWKIDNYTSEIEGYSDFTGSGTFGPVQINSGVATVVQSGLSASTSYTISARAFTRLFYSPVGTSSSQFTAPPPPAFTFSSQTANSITWIISSNYDASATYTFIGTGTFSQTENTVVQSGLSSGTGYTIAGSATKNGLNSGNGPTSDIAYTTLLTPQFELVSRTNNSINWKISDSTYGSSASYSISGTGTITRSGQNITQSGLSAETSYSISGTATLNNFTTPVGTSNSVFTAPNAPSFTTSSTSNSIVVTITSYSTNYSYRATATAGSVPSNITSSTFTITGLSPLQTIAITLFRTRNSVESSGTTLSATTSPPVFSWSPYATTSLNSDIVYGNNLFVSTGLEGKINTSTNGNTWTARTSGVSANLNSVSYGNGVYVVVGDSNVLLSSTDGTTWTSRSSGLSGSLNAITYGGGIFVAFSTTGGGVTTSSNGTTWVGTTAGFSSTISIQDISYGNGLFVAVGTSGNTQERIYTSSNGTTWTQQTTNFGITRLNAVAYANGIFVVGGNSGKLAYSTDGITWTQTTSTIGTTQINEIGFANGYFVAFGISSQTAISQNGATWYANTHVGGITINGSAYGNGRIVAAGGTGDPSLDLLYRSPW